MNFSDELIEKAKSAKTPEELITMAKAENIELTNEQASEYFAMLNQKSGEVSDEELDNVAGGACRSERSQSGGLIVRGNGFCSRQKCRSCGHEGGGKAGGGHIGGCCPCGKRMICKECVHVFAEYGNYVCGSEHNKRRAAT